LPRSPSGSRNTATAHAVGGLLGRSGTSDVVDATVVTLAITTGAHIVTGDRGDIARLVSAAGARLIISRL